MPLAVPEVVSATGVMAVTMPLLVVTFPGVYFPAPRAVPEKVTAAALVNVYGRMPGGIAAPGGVGRRVPLAVPVEMAAAAEMDATGEAPGRMARVVPSAVPVIVPASPSMVVSPVKLGIVAVVGVRNVGPMAVPEVVSARIRMDMDMPLIVHAGVGMRRLPPSPVVVGTSAILVVDMLHGRRLVAVRRRVVVDIDPASDRGTKRHSENEQ